MLAQHFLITFGVVQQSIIGTVIDHTIVYIFLQLYFRTFYEMENE